MSSKPIVMRRNKAFRMEIATFICHDMIELVGLMAEGWTAYLREDKTCYDEEAPHEPA